MTSIPRVPTSDSADSSASKQRKRRKWDQPAETPSSQNVAAISGAYYSNPLAATIQARLPQQQAVAILQKLNQMQDEVIAREIVINDVDSNTRYKLTKRSTQEEIQKVTGAIVIIRGMYKPPNAPPTGERPLYLHITAGSHLETMAEKIKSIDLASAMVEEMLKHGSSGTEVNGNHHLNACVYLGFETDPALNIAVRIRGPNDQYVNHIMNETGVTVLLRGQGSGSSESGSTDGGQHPLHLFLSSNNLQSLEHAKVLAENLMDTISAECSAKRFSSSKVYGAVPPPPQLLAEVRSSMEDSSANMQPGMSSALLCNTSSGMLPHVHSVSGQSTANPGYYPHGTLTQGPTYNGYGGIYPHATPLQQVALALRHSTSPATTSVGPAITTSYVASSASTSYSTRSSQKRKFKELPHVNPKQTSLQVSEHAKPCELTSDVGTNNDKILTRPSTNGMLPDPTKLMPPPPPKFTTSLPAFHCAPSAKVLHPNPKVMQSPSPIVSESSRMLIPHKKSTSAESVPDTLIKLMEYGDDDDDDDDVPGEPSKTPASCTTSKPFWAI